MSAHVVFLFDTEAEAEAFREGVEWVNDDAIEYEFIGPVDESVWLGPNQSGWQVVFADDDAKADDVRDHRHG